MVIAPFNQNISSIMGDQMEPEEFKSYQAAFDAFDWGHNGKIKYSSLQVLIPLKHIERDFFYIFVVKIRNIFYKSIYT